MKRRYEYEQCPHPGVHPGPHTWNRLDATDQPIYPTLICLGVKEQP